MLDKYQEHEQIRDTMARYTIAGDRLRIEEFIAVFTENAILESEGVPDSDAFRFEGREAIRGWFNRWSKPASKEQTTHQATFVRHHLTTSQIKVVGENQAEARTYWIAYTDIGPDHSGVYVDTFEKVDQQWLIAHRKIRLDWRHPGSLFSTAIERTRV